MRKNEISSCLNTPTRNPLLTERVHDYFTEQKQQISLTLEALKYTDNYVHGHYKFIINIFNDAISLQHNNYILNEIKKILQI